MRRKIAFVLALCLMISLCSIGSPLAYAEDWKLPEGTRIYKPGRSMALDFGTLTILDAGFAKKAQSIIQVSTTTKTINGVSKTTENHRAGYRTAKDGQVLFAFKGLLFNSSDQSITLESLNPTIRFSEDEPTKMYGYPAVPFGRDEYYTLEPGQDVEIVFACTAPNGMYSGSGDILLEFAGGTFGFQRADLGNYKSIGFTAADGEEAGDLTEVPAVQEEGVIVANQPHVDEVRAEDVSLEYDSKKGEYRVHVKLRILSDLPLIHGKLPDRIGVRVQFLDSSGDVLPEGDIGIDSNKIVTGGFTDLSKGQAGWDNSYKFVSKDVVDRAESVRVPSYSYSYTAINSDGSTQPVNGTFTDPLVIPISDILPAKKTAAQDKDSSTHGLPATDANPDPATNEAPTYDPIEIEKVFIRNSSSGLKIGFKVRNTGDTGKEIIQLNLQVLDAAGDVLASVDTNVYNLEAGQAGKTEFKRIECSLDEIGSIRVFGYRYGTGTEIVTHFDSKDRYRLITPIVVSIEDVTIE